MALLVVGSGGIIAYHTFGQTTQSVEELMRSLFVKSSTSSIEQSRVRIRAAIPTLKLLDSLLRLGKSWQPEDLAAQFADTLRANPHFAAVTYSMESGQHVEVERIPDGTLRTIFSETDADGRNSWQEFVIRDDGSLIPEGESADKGYDPRNRSFYKLAHSAGHRVWTQPYIFYEMGLPGFTCAAPHYAADGEFLGVLTVDFDVNCLSDLVTSVKPSPNSQVILFTNDGIVLAATGVRMEVQRGLRDKGKLLQIEDVKQESLAALFRSGLLEQITNRGAVSDTGELFSFDHDGQRMLATCTTFNLDQDLEWVVGITAPESDFLGAIRKSYLQAVFIALIALGGAVLLGIVLAGMMARPLAQVSEEMERIGRFDFDEEDKPNESPTMFHEIAMINRSVGAMKRGLRSFGYYVPRDLVHNLLSTTGEVSNQLAERELTLFFSDIARFTTLTESLSPTELRDRLNAYLEEMNAVIGEYQGTIDKFLGDGIMAFWGAPQENARHAALACRAALECQRRLKERSRKEKQWKKLATRMGLASGPALVGSIGTKQRMNYTAMGDVVNLASRLEGLNKRYKTKILITEATYRAAESEIVARPLGKVIVQGKRHSVKVYEPLSSREEADSEILQFAELSEQALTAYLEANFNEACRIYREILSRVPGDHPATQMLERAEELRQNPPDEDWTGVETMHTK